MVFILFAFVLLVLQRGLAVLLRLPEPVGVGPDLLLILLAFVACEAPAIHAYWAAIVLGLITDSLATYQGQGPVLGPAGLGFLAGSYMVVQLRGMVFRDSPLALGALVLVAGAFVHLVVSALLTVRNMGFVAGPFPAWNAGSELLGRFFSLLYTSLLALPLGWVLVRTRSWWGFVTPSGPWR